MIWFTSDTHFFHKNVIPYCSRPFKTIEEMHEAIISNWNSCVGVNDIVYHLGDFGFANGKKLADIRARLSGRIHLILGNHDDSISKRKWLEEVKVEGVYDNLDVAEFHLNHYPITGESNEVPDRFKEKRPTCTDKWILCGHIHDRWRIRDNCFNVGVDVNEFKPILLDTIRMEIKLYEQENNASS